MLGTVVDIQRWLAADQALAIEARHQRDRQIAQQTIADPDALRRSDAATQRRAVLSWWTQLQSEQADVSERVPRLDLALGATSFVLSAIGFVLGLSACAAALTYTGAYPVNLISLLALLVLLPGLLLLGTLLLLPRRLPGFGWLRSLLTGMNPGHWLSVWLNRFLSQPVFGMPVRDGSRAARLSKWLMLRLSQCLALGFFVGAIVALLWLVVFSDLAFGWSTTLQTNAATITTVFQSAAWPWSSWFADAYPSSELVRVSQFYRGDDASAAPALGAWWPFVLMCLLVYGLLPRLALYVFSRLRYRRAVSDFLLGDREVQGLVQRMSSAWVARGVNAPDDSRVAARVESVSAVALPAAPMALLVWNDALDEDRIPAWCHDHGVTVAGNPVRLGSTVSLADEQTRTTTLNGQHALLLTKGWEPPLLELHDALRRLAQALGDDARLYVQPLGLDGHPASGSDAQVWQQSIQSLQHPQILMASPA